jgi:hypothetical protein
MCHFGIGASSIPSFGWILPMPFINWKFYSMGAKNYFNKCLRRSGCAQLLAPNGAAEREHCQPMPSMFRRPGWRIKNAKARPPERAVNPGIARFRKEPAATAIGRQSGAANIPAGGVRERGQQGAAACLTGNIPGRGSETRKRFCPPTPSWVARHDCHKYLTFANTGVVVQRSGRKDGRPAPENRIPQRAQRWPKLCLGETYAGHFLSSLGCIAAPSLLPVLPVAKRPSMD